jgi:predicted unusual protein kinase regulating ubiquinone biosynthesis (AarF/ABC1/UbiB family)
MRRTWVGRSAKVAKLGAKVGAVHASTAARKVFASTERRIELDERRRLTTAAAVADELGQMKGALMKLGQMASYLDEGLPEPLRMALAQLRSSAPPMSAELADGVVEAELGMRPADLFVEWDPEPIAAASIGQVHRAIYADPDTGEHRPVAVKVQYPGVDAAIAADLRNADMLGTILKAGFGGLEPDEMVAEIKERLTEELDYELEARNQQVFADFYRGHPYIHVPEVVPQLSTARVLTSELVNGHTWEELLTWDQRERDLAGETIFRFVFRSLYRMRAFNGDPHPGNYLFHGDGTVTFLDFGLVKKWAPGELESLIPLIDPLLDHRPYLMAERMVEAGFLAPDHGLDPERIWEYVSAPYTPYLHDEFTFRPDFASSALGKLLDLDGPYADVMAKLNLPPSFVILDRVIWGMSAILGRLGARNRWRPILDEYRLDAPPVTDLGHREAAWRRQHHPA